MYLLVVQEFLEQRRVPRIGDCCKEARVHRVTAWRWFKDPTFLRHYARIFRAHVDARDAMVDFAVQTSAMLGSMKAAELNLRRRGLYDGPIPDGPIGGGPPGTGAGGVAVGVTFVGLPQPPDAAQRARLQPPPGSAMILTATGVLEDATPAPKGK